jgi:hypothetical protein
MSVLAPFNPAYTKGQTVNAAAVAASVAVLASAKQLTITNLGNNIAYVRTGTGTIAATAADMPILPGTQVSLTKGENQETVSYISAAGTSLHIIPGEGW